MNGNWPVNQLRKNWKSWGVDEKCFSNQTPTLSFVADLSAIVPNFLEEAYLLFSLDSF